MAVKIEREPEITQEALEALVQHLSPSKVARLMAAWQLGTGDYVAMRKQLFAGETVATLARKILEEG